MNISSARKALAAAIECFANHIVASHKLNAVWS